MSRLEETVLIWLAVFGGFGFLVFGVPWLVKTVLLLVMGGM